MDKTESLKSKAKLSVVHLVIVACCTFVTAFGLWIFN